MSSFLQGTSASSATGGERRRFGDPPAENTGKNRKRTPRIRHPMEVQGDVRFVVEYLFGILFWL